MSSIFRILGKGIMVILPFALVVWLLYFLFEIINSTWTLLLYTASFMIDRFANEKIETQFPSILVGIGAIIFMLLIIFYVGYKFEKNQNAIFIKVGEWSLSKIPFIGSIYHTIKDLVTMISGNSKDKYLGVAFIEISNNEIIGFITQEEENYFWVFCPFAPPTSGLLFRIHKDKIRKSNMSVSEGLKKVVSFGVK
ncbi:DUF502 domain-containing protein [Helicobacter muridarum]|uniref:DUF502 domain-containing protein n=1 Tax=Helicobacter muridarum TaxID=216 RepID=A0A099U2F5_9HELI|nr:DUF502 domain-containing protein [Helicobacter muridarum]TLE01686.1 DUF502 domain-containing protein [Helicobacter muridarum]STQ86326.1 Uncharacterized conserved protein [Helicobacter muridarum]